MSVIKMVFSEISQIVFLVGQQKIDRNPLLIRGLRFYFLTKNPKGSNLGSFVANNVARFLPKIGFDEGRRFGQ
jgi:hypothetical protein